MKVNNKFWKSMEDKKLGLPNDTFEQWAVKKYRPGKDSARSIPIGYKFNGVILVDKVIKPINICPHCKSTNTFHKWIQTNKDMIGNVWRVQKIKDRKGHIYAKFDYCLNCSSEFLIEMFLWKRDKALEKKKIEEAKQNAGNAGYIQRMFQRFP